MLRHASYLAPTFRSMQLMNVDGLTRENVASHLQKYRLQLRKEEEGKGEELDKEDDGEDLVTGDTEVPLS